jgi:probable F420-dependent oxidoreductase
MKIGVVYPQTELRGDPAAVGRLAQAVEELGFDHLLAYDHVLGAVHTDRTPPLTGPYTERDPFHDPLVMFAYLAGVTERIELVTGVLILPQRQTALVARQAADVDLLSGGRLRLGVGIGWNHVEYDALGQDFHTRGAREEEQIGLLRRLFTEPIVDFAGRFDRVDRASLLPKPARQIPIWLGGGEAARERAVRIGDGFIFTGRGGDAPVDALRDVRGALERLGRSPDDFGTDWCVSAGDGGIDAVAGKVDAWRRAGGTHASIVTMGLGLDTVDAHIEHLERVAEVLGVA